ASADNTARLWAVWPLLTADTVAFDEIIALRALSEEERASLFLTDADAVSGQEHATKTADDPPALCDQLAADPFDPHKGVLGVPFDNIDAEKVILACRSAVSAAPNEPRFSYQLGRAVGGDEKRDEAAALIRAAAEKGYSAAENDLGSLYEDGSALAKDEV